MSESDKKFSDICLNYLLSGLNVDQNAHTDVESNQTIDIDNNGALIELEKVLFVSILTDMAHQIGILNGGAILNSVNSTATNKVPMAKRFAQPVCLDMYDEATLRPFNEALLTMCDEKLENNLNELRDLLLRCAKEIETVGKFETLREFVQRRSNDVREEYTLIDVHMSNSMRLDELTEKWKRLKGIDYRLKDHLEMYQDECDEKRIDLKRTHLMERNMVRRWEEARLEQMTDVFNTELTRLNNYVTELSKKCVDNELTIERLKVYNECKYLRIEKLTEYWTERCSAEKMRLGEQIKTTKNEIKSVWSEYEALCESYRERDAFIENYRVQQQLLQLQREHEMKQKQAAILIQAWWRGTMVRKCLGPYRPKKKKGKKGGK